MLREREKPTINCELVISIIINDLNQLYTSIGVYIYIYIYIHIYIHIVIFYKTKRACKHCGCSFQH